MFPEHPVLPTGRRLTGPPWIRLAIAALLCAGAASTSFSEAIPPVDAVRQVVAEWAKVRAETVRLEANWEFERELLASTLRAEREQAQALADQKKTLESRTAAERSSLAALATENAAGKADLAAADDRLRKISEQLVALRPSLPPRLSQALELPYRSLANPDLTPGERMQFVTTILNRCMQFNRTITYGDEPLTLPGETGRRMIEVIYWGASNAYALDRTGGKAWLGSPGAQGWSWAPAPGAAKSVAKLIAIYRDKSDPDFVEVPARISGALQD